MSANAAVLANFGTDQWNADVYESLSVASRLSSMVKDSTQSFYLAYHLRRLNSRLDGLFGEVFAMIEGKKAIPPSDPPTPERIRNAINSMYQLHSVLSQIFNSAKCRRLTNNSLFSSQVRKLAQMSENALEFAEWLEMACLHQEEVAQIFERARAEKAKGEVYTIE